MFKYIKIGQILKEVIEKGRQLKNMIYNNKQIRPSQIPSTYSLLSLLLNNFKLIKQAQQQISRKSHVSISNPYLMMIIIAEYINTGKIVGGGKLKRVVLQYKHIIPNIARQSKINKLIVQVRLRKNAQDFQRIDQHLITLARKDQIVPQVYHLQQQQYSLLTKDDNFNILNSTTCVMQSFSSSVPPFLLMRGVQQKWKNKKVDVIDACSAPGNKTIQIAEYLGSLGKVFAFEKNERRFQLLNNTINKYQVGNIVPIHGDFLTIQPQKKYKRVKLILLDPSCSGSGMLTNFTRDSNLSKSQDCPSGQTFQQFCMRKYEELDEKQKARVENLHNFQVQLLNHSAKFKPHRLSYSTCSIYRRQNQDVVSKFLQSHPQYSIKHYNYQKLNNNIRKGFGEQFLNCLRIDPRPMQTDGFFVTIFIRRTL